MASDSENIDPVPPLFLHSFKLLLFTTFAPMFRWLLLFCLFPAFYQAQYEAMAKNAFLNEHIQRNFEQWSITQPSVKFHAAFRPYLSSSYVKASDSALPYQAYSFRNFFLSRTYNERPEARNWFNLQFHPLIETELGYDALQRKVLPAAAGGMHLKLNINDDFTFAATMIAGNQVLPFFIDTTVALSNVLPEFGQAYPTKTAAYNFFDYQGYLSYSPHNNKIFNFQLGRGKHFIGNGQRSVLLSDFAPAYPYFRINTNIWRLQYNVWYTLLNDVSQAAQMQRRFRHKYATFHYLSWNVTKNFNIGLFENIVWRGTDTNQVRNFEVNYLNPLIFFRPVEYSVGSPDNSFIGLNLSGILFKTIRLYGQLGLDEFYLSEIRARRGWWANKQAWQLGARYINAFRIKGLELVAEYNQVRPYTYTHGLPDQNYGHYAYPLAHPLGANFRELLGSVSLRRDRWEIYLQTMLVKAGRDSLNRSSNVGSNIFLSYNTRHAEYGHYTGQGLSFTMLQAHLRFTYFVIPAMNLRLELGYIQRSEQIPGIYTLQNPYLYIGLKSGIWNSYRNF